MVNIIKISNVTPEEWAQVHEFNRNLTEEFLQQEHLSKKTIGQYRSTLQIFFRWVMQHDQNRPLHELKPRSALRYQNWLLSTGLGYSGVKLKRSAVSSICQYLELYLGEEYPMFRNIFNKGVPNAARSTVHEKVPLTKDEFDLLVEKLTETKQWQILCFLMMAYSSASRREELRQLRKEISTYEKVPGKTYYKAHEVRAKGKGSVGVRRCMAYDEKTMQVIKKWLEVRGDDDCPYLFVRKQKNGKTTQLSASTFNAWCSDILSPLIGGKRLFPHLLRSTRATHVVTVEGKDINAVKQLLGHKDSKTSEIYVVRDESSDMDTLFDDETESTPQEAR